MLPYFSSNALNIIPPAKSPAIEMRITGSPNQPIIIAIWYTAKQSALKIYANFRVETFFNVRNAKPRKKNSSSREFTNEI